jgi:ubiquinone/menaquinone biosynthesis C-methylase UbiE
MTYSIQNHYQTLAKRYDQFWASSPEFITFLTEKIIEALQLVTTDQLVDLGCGTGIYSQAILNQIQLNHPLLCVDPSDQMLAKIPKNNQYQCINQGAIEFSQQQGNYDKIFIKEMIHHISDKELLFKNLFKRIKEKGSLLIILLPPTIEYPLFDSFK